MPADFDKLRTTLPGVPRESIYGEGSGVPSGNPLSLYFPCNEIIWNEARRLVPDRSVRLEDIATCCAQDPVIGIELLRISNAMYFAGGRTPITTIKTAIVRLGHDVVLQTLNELALRPPFENEEVRHWFEIYRNKCKRNSIISRILAEAVSRNLSDDCQSAGLFICVGEMLAVAHFREKYVQLAEEHSRGGVNYYLGQKFRFDVEQMGLKYLRKNGLPEALLFAIDREAQVRSPDRAVLRPLCMAASEMLDAFDANRWEKLAPGRTLPPKSSLRLLQMNDSQYLKVYERVAEYLFSERLAEERRRKEEFQKHVLKQDPEQGSPEDSDKDSEVAWKDKTDHNADDWHADLANLLQGGAQPDPHQEVKTHSEDQEPGDTHEPQFPKNLADNFSLSHNSQKVAPRVESPRAIRPPPQLRTSRGNEVVEVLSDLVQAAKNSEELLTDLLERLITEGPFEKSALIVVSKDRQYAIVVAARGPNIGNGQKLSLDDPLSPLARSFSKVQSYGNKRSKESPFGSRAFALAPLDADHETPVVLYADCGNNGSITFEARRIFRTVVDVLNQRLPTIPGGIPIEIDY
ncbi:MAG: HDOD domain-containing protein [Deltaproteobacteria bacterium]|nr:HDOD domain-containing protein [Deltaproteobacteria bacterium]